MATVLCLGLEAGANAGVTSQLEALGHTVLQASELVDVPKMAGRVSPIHLVVVNGDRWRLPPDAFSSIGWGNGTPAIIVMTARVAQIPTIPFAPNAVVSYLSEPVVTTTLYSTVRLTLELATLKGEIAQLRSAQVGYRAADGEATGVSGVRSVAESIGFDLSNVERVLIDEALRVSKGNRTVAARMLGIHVRTLRRKLRPLPAVSVS